MVPRLNPFLVVTVLSWGFNFVALKVLYEEMTPPAASFLRYFAMYAALVLICRLRRESLRPKREDFWRIQGVGFLAIGVYVLLFMEGMKGTTPAEGAIVLATTPIFTYLLSCLVRQERFAASALVGCVVAFVGVTLVILGGSAAGHGSVEGNLTILVASVVWACSAVAMKPLLARYSPTAVLTMAMPGGLPVMAAYGLMPTLATDLGRITPNGWLMFLVVSVVSGAIGFVCFYTGLRQVGASGAALYQYFIPPTSALFAWLVMGKALGPIQFVGLAVVLGGVAYAGHARMRAMRLAAAATA